MSKPEPDMGTAETLAAWGVDVEEAIEELRIDQEKLAGILTTAAKQLRDIAEQSNLVCTETHLLRAEFDKMITDMHDTNNRIGAMFETRDLEMKELKGRLMPC